MNKIAHPELRKLYALLKPFYQAAKRGFAQEGHFFQNCLRASFAKAYEFNVLANSRSQSRGSFFLAAGLRSICEDLILLRYLGPLSKANRERIVLLLMHHEVLANLKAQQAFFEGNRPFQPVLKTPDDYEQELERVTVELQAFWKVHGWNLNGKATMPQIRQLAERRGLDTLYDFIYRLTCDVVHFNPQVLLRSGWGKLPDVEFSTENFDPYYQAFSVVYGSFLFCVYFELLRPHLKPNAETMRQVGKIRKHLRAINRWPEIVTYEEMNVKPPPEASLLFQVASRVIFESSPNGKRRNLIKRSVIARAKAHSPIQNKSR